MVIGCATTSRRAFAAHAALAEESYRLALLMQFYAHSFLFFFLDKKEPKTQDCDGFLTPNKAHNC